MFLKVETFWLITKNKKKKNVSATAFHGAIDLYLHRMGNVSAYSNVPTSQPSEDAAIDSHVSVFYNNTNEWKRNSNHQKPNPYSMGWNRFINIPKINIDDDLRCLFFSSLWSILNFWINILLGSGKDERVNANLCTRKFESNLRRRTKSVKFYRSPKMCEKCAASFRWWFLFVIE